LSSRPAVNTSHQPSTSTSGHCDSAEECDEALDADGESDDGNESEESNDMDDEEFYSRVAQLVPEEYTNDEAMRTVASIPKKSLLQGLFCGAIPLELTDLTRVEESMISLYNPISKLMMHGGKYYKGCATTYTIVNNLLKITCSLPAMPTLDAWAILRKRGATAEKDLQFRPYYVKSALVWLCHHNHLYKDVVLQWPSEYCWDLSCDSSKEYVDICFIEMSHEELQEVDAEDDLHHGKPDVLKKENATDGELQGGEADEDNTSELRNSSTNPGEWAVF